MFGYHLSTVQTNRQMQRFGFLCFVRMTSNQSRSICAYVCLWVSPIKKTQTHFVYPIRIWTNERRKEGRKEGTKENERTNEGTKKDGENNETHHSKRPSQFDTVRLRVYPVSVCTASPHIHCGVVVVVSTIITRNS